MTPILNGIVKEPLFAAGQRDTALLTSNATSSSIPPRRLIAPHSNLNSTQETGMLYKETDRHFIVAGPPSDLPTETAGWFTNTEYESAWFEVAGDGDGIGFHFAVVVYIGQHLRSIAGPRVDAMHIVAQIEGKPNPRRTWNRKY
jgi:hypothetical protein